MSDKVKIVLMMFAVAAVVGTMIYLFFGSVRWAFAISGVLLLTDLTFVPRMLPHIFKDNDKGRRK